MSEQSVAYAFLAFHFFTAFWVLVIWYYYKWVRKSPVEHKREAHKKSTDEILAAVREEEEWEEKQPLRKNWGRL